MMWLNVNRIIAIFATLLLLETTAAANITCMSCDKDENCLNGVATTTCENATKCFTRVNDDFSITRGCLKDEDLANCTTPSCVHCESGDNCNNQSICKTCDSTTDPKCAQTDASTLQSAICDKSNTQCMISVLESKTERGCITEELQKTCTDEKTCKMCTGGACNVGIFPESRISCHQCANTTDCANTQSNSSSAALPCLQYVENDKCYMYGSDETHVTRGCISDVGEANKCAKSVDEKCQTCNTTNCNSLSYMVDQSLKCIKCSSKDNAQCTAAQVASTAENCANKIPYYAEGKCYTLTADDGVMTRGCFYDLGETDQAACTASSEKCTTCTNENGCNNAAEADFTCIRCRSDEDTQCRWEADKLTGAKCTNTVQTADDKKCFWGTWQTDLVIRGCLIDLNPRDQFICNDAKVAICQTCTTANCNTKGGATYLLLSNGLLAFGVLTLWRLR
ncbi:unnamed protein product [Ceratitis capitata]|uniref:(Mediterranean fruit fly) hypothetical protein n=1 Tax=Ceratitis capitata TaxID=7213 RepID=A0A811UNA9_CERCA|nr:unnamed protein product [Ceratitis capitata]